MRDAIDAGSGSIRLPRPWTSTVVLTMIAAALGVAYMATARIGNDTSDLPEHSRNFVQMFDLNAEANVPSWFSSSLWLVSALLAVRAGQLARDLRYLVLAGVFVLLSADEAAFIHESIGTVMDLHISMGGWLAWSWVLYGAALFAVTAIFALPLLWSLPRSILAAFVLGGLIFLSGALGFEMYSSTIYEGQQDFPSWLNWNRIILAEEVLEMLGVIINIHALLLTNSFLGPPR